MSAVLAIDADTYGVAFCVLDESAEVLECQYLRRRVRNSGVFFPDYDRDLGFLVGRAIDSEVRSFLELPYLKPEGSRGERCGVKGFAHLCEVVGEVKAAFRRSGIELVGLQASEWMEGLFWKGISRETAKDEVFMLAGRVAPFGWASWNEHMRDAWAIATWAGSKAKATAK